MRQQIERLEQITPAQMEHLRHYTLPVGEPITLKTILAATVEHGDGCNLCEEIRDRIQSALRANR
ncbi:MAG: hypothetical protein Q8O55_06610, partial [Dehalococcoidales bacterium]|nr:hypothetical protein [Dehalococcoidales bacterium]